MTDRKLVAKFMRKSPKIVIVCTIYKKYNSRNVNAKIPKPAEASTIAVTCWSMGLCNKNCKIKSLQSSRHQSHYTKFITMY